MEEWTERDKEIEDREKEMMNKRIRVCIDR